MTTPLVGVVILAFGDEPLLGEVVAAVLGSTGVAVDLVVVDNGYTGTAGDQLRSQPLRWIDPGRNTGFAAGSNLGARAVGGDCVAFVNSDAVVAADALQALTSELDDAGVGIATAQVLLYDEPDIVNSAGNPVHYSLVSWAGGWGDSVDRHRDRQEPASASGTLLALRRAVFEELGGFHEMLFAYGEDVELSLRAWQSGYRVRYVPTARVWHRYRFGRHPGKLGLLERNRWINLLTLLEFRTLLRLAPGLLAVDAGVWVSALRGGWLRDKARATAWLLGHGRSIRDRRAWVQGRRRLPDAAILPLLATRIEPSARTGELVPDGVNTLISALGRLAGAGQEQPANAERARSGGS